MNCKRVSKKNNKKISIGINYAVNGLLISIKTERNIRIHISIMILVIITGSIFRINLYEWIICFILFGAVISSELINTALEKGIDVIIPYEDEKAKQVKDIAAGAVLVWAIISAVIGALIFLPKIIFLLIH